MYSPATSPDRLASSRARLFLASAVGFLALVVAALLTPWQVAALLAWDATAAVFSGWIWLTIRNMDGPTTARAAAIEDASRVVADFALVGASLASLVGVGLALLKASSEKGGVEAFIILVAVLTVVLSWLTVHIVFTLGYARLYYKEGRGIDFGSDPEPDYRDFAYLGFTIGMTYQVSDTNITSRTIRRVALRHSILSFVFGTAVIAVVINVVAGLLNG